MSVRHLSRASILLAAVAALAHGVVAQSFGPRQVTAPPEDILSGRLRLPEPGTVRTLSRVAVLPIELERAAGTRDGWAFEARVPVDGVAAIGDASFALAGRDSSGWTLRVTGPDGRALDLERDVRSGAVLRRSGVVPEGVPGALAGLVADRYDVANAERGLWTVRVEVAAARPLAASNEAFLVVAGDSRLHLASHLTTHERRSDRLIGIAACVLDGSDAGLAPRVGLVADASMRVESEVGSWTLALIDDGRNADGAAGDGVFGAYLPLGISGPVAVEVRAEGVTDEGRAFLRTTRHAFTVIEPEVVLDGSATTSVESARELAIDIGATLLGSSRLHVSAEVWGTDPAGARVPVCWLSRMIQPDPAAVNAAGAGLRLVLDARWLNRAGASAPLELRRVRVQDPDTHVPHDQRRRIALPLAPVPSLVGDAPTSIEPDMLKSIVAPLSGVELAAGTFVEVSATFLAERVLMTTHGYCSSNVWGAAGFSEPRINFLDLSQGRSHDQFAQLLLAFGTSAYSHGIVGHSQGGAAALQLHTYYASGLDAATGARRIQSVGTPYQGSPLASFGGFTCGVIDDMTPAGATLWLTGIPSWARADVYYWTTSNSGSACQFFSDFFLSNPEDGVVEMSRGQLSGGNNMGHVTGWCHSTGMSNPAQYTDAARNAEMDAQAAR